jgi:ribonuclease BN (tRNA processing enzyme)
VALMRAVVLGAGTAIPAAGFSPAGLYVRVGREQVLFDAGPGTVQRLHQAGGSFKQIDRVFLSHYHLDHCLDLATLLFALRIPDQPRTKPLAVYGPPGLKRFYRRLNSALNGWLTPTHHPLTLKEVRSSSLTLPGYTVATLPMRHAAEAIGYRVTDAHNRTLAYSGDTDVCEEVVALGRHAHALVLECSMPDERKVAGHLTPTECGRIAADAGCRHLILTHFYPVFGGYDIRKRVKRAFRGRLTLARDLSSFRV